MTASWTRATLASWNVLLKIFLVGSAVVLVDGVDTKPLVAAVSLGGSGNVTPVYTIQFDQVGVTDPSFTFPVGDDVITVGFGTHFVGQSLGPHNMLVDTTPTGDLALAAGNIGTLFDIGNPNGIVLGGIDGNKLFTSPLAIHFDSGVNLVSFDLGHLDANSDTRIEAYDEDGNSLGVFGDLNPGYDNYVIRDVDGANNISGVSIYVPEGGMDWEGFGLNNVGFGLADDVIPEPATVIIWSLLTACGYAATCIQRRRAASASES